MGNMEGLKLEVANEMRNVENKVSVSMNNGDQWIHCNC